MARRPLLLMIPGLTLAAFVLGCGDGRPQRLPVSGRVLIDGKPVEHGFVRVIPANDRPASGALGPDGRFTLTTFDPGDGCVAGKHPVTIIACELINPQSQRWHAPKQYGNPNTSKLEVDITGETDAMVIDLTWGEEEPFVEQFDEE